MAVHEFGIVQRLMDTVRRKAEESGVARVKRIRVVLGKLAEVSAGSLNFAYTSLAPHDKMFSEAELDIDERDAAVRCKACGAETAIAEPVATCPRCGEGPLEVTRGRELYVDFFEGE
jgi:hydrogenase nickel incorporation protein HypA/HybF